MENYTLRDPAYPKNGDVVRLKDGNYAVIVKRLGIKEVRQLGFFGYEVRAKGKEFVVNENDVTLMDDNAIREIFIKEKIEP